MLEREQQQVSVTLEVEGVHDLILVKHNGFSLTFRMSATSFIGRPSGSSWSTSFWRGVSSLSITSDYFGNTFVSMLGIRSELQVTGEASSKIKFSFE